jgi:hypothetical protein
MLLLCDHYTEQIMYNYMIYNGSFQQRFSVWISVKLMMLFFPIALAL